MASQIISSVLEAQRVQSDIRLLKARISCFLARYNGATTIDDFFAYYDDLDEATEHLEFLKASKMELQALLQKASEMRAPSLTPEEITVFTDEVLATLTTNEMHSLLYSICCSPDGFVPECQDIYKRGYSRPLPRNTYWAH